MLYQPTNIYPSMTGSLGNGVVDVTKPLSVSWQVNGNSAMSAFQIVIYKNDAASTKVYSTGKLTSGCPFYGVDYAGNIQFFSYTITSSQMSGAGMANGNEYKMVITQWWGSSSVTQTSASVFLTRSAPSVTLGSIPSPLEVREYSFTAAYTQAQGDNLNWVRWELALVGDGEYETLKDTGKIYGTAQLRLDYDGFFSGSTYAVRCSVQTQNGIEASTGWQSFSVSYETTPLSGTLSACPVGGVSGVKLTFPPVRDIPAEITGNYTMSGSYLNLTSGAKAVYDEVNGAPMDFQKPFEVAWRGKNNANGTLLKITGMVQSSSQTVQMPEIACWDSAAYGNGTYVAVSASGEIAYSTDEGQTWTAAQTPQDGAGWFSVCYGGGKFVAIACGSAVAAYSADGITWTVTALPASTEWTSVCYGNGKFVAVSVSESAAYSSDGVTWSAALMPASRGWYSVCYGGGKFVAVANSSAYAAYSEDGIAWTESQLPSVGCWNCVCYGGGAFIAVQTGASCAFSQNGTNWYSRTMPEDLDWMGIGYGGGKFLAVAAESATMAQTTDGITWKQKTFSANANWNTAVYGTDGFLVLADGTRNAAVVTESGGLAQDEMKLEVEAGTLQFQSATMPSSSGWNEICYGNNAFFAVTSGYSYGGLSSADAMTWQIVTMRGDSVKDWKSVCYGNGKYVATRTGLTWAYSTDGHTWTDTTVPFGADSAFRPIVYANGKFTSLSGSVAYNSTDGITWTYKALPVGAAFKALCYGNGMYVSFNWNSMRNLLYSTDGENWTSTSISLPASVSSGSCRCVCYGKGRFVAVNSTSYCVYSTDGMNWSASMISDTIAHWVGVCYGNGIFVATALNTNKAAYSEDGISWTLFDLPTTGTWYSIGYGDGRFVTLSYSGNAAVAPITSASSTMKITAHGQLQSTLPIGSGGDLAVLCRPSATMVSVGGHIQPARVKMNFEKIQALELGGAQSCNYLLVSDGIISDGMKILTDASYHPLDQAALFYADYDGSTNGGGVGDTKVSSFGIYRWSPGDSILTHIANTSAINGNVLIDCGAVTGKEYIYYAYGIGNDTFAASALISNNVTPCFWDWTVFSCTQDENGVYHAQEIFRFGKNLVSGSITNNNAPQILENFTRYPTIQPSPQNYQSGTLQSLIGVITDGKYSDTLNMKKSILGLSTTRNTLFLKNRKGELLKIRAGGAISMETMDNTTAQAQTVSLPWVEVGSAENAQIVLTNTDDAWPF